MDFHTFTKETLHQFDHFLKDCIPNKSGTQLEEAMHYSLEAGGKRLRPLLLLAVLQAFGKPVEKGLPAAAALEMIHTYSLIHDDLPAMDDDDLRRGKPTNHIAFSESTAILAGDGLLTQAFSVVADTDAPAETTLQLVRLLSECSGYIGMVGGQQADINGEKKDLSIEELESIHLRKTGALIQFAFVGGALLAEQPTSVTQILQKCADQLGVAYQIRDDILDVIGDEEELGKATGADEKLGKSTYPALLGLEEAKTKLIEELDEVKELLRSITEKAPSFDYELITTFVDQLYLKESE